MLTRFKVSGFKNLLDLDVSFGPFTCIAGPNGIGKSNIFDAIHFLSLLADRPLMDAATAVRDSGRKARDISGLFYRSGEYLARRIDFEMELLVPEVAEDDFGQTARATITTLRYALSIGRRDGSNGATPEPLVIEREELTHIPVGEAKEHLGFPHSKEWRDSVVKGVRRSPHFISTDHSAGVIRIHQDGGSRGKPLSYQRENLKRTVLAASNAAESPTILVVRRELQSWLQLQLEPSSLRRPDEFTDPPYLTASGDHMPSVLDRLARNDKSGRFYTAIANRLAELIGDVREVQARRDEARELISAYVTFKDGTPHAANSLSDGTLRFLALAILEEDPEFRGLLCLEEPENGIHPDRIPAMIRLLTDLAMDAEMPAGPDNPLRQVIVNTHSPSVAAEVPYDSLLLAREEANITDSSQLPTLDMAPLEATWRVRVGRSVAPRGAVVSYLRPVRRTSERRGRVADRAEYQMELDFGREP
ncbi:MAG: AAA family ATPase [Bryobacteraceae bacterium]